MSLPRINLVIVGHKDHGKSTLIGRLLYDSEAIPEQKLQEVRDELEKSGDETFRFAYLLDSFREEREGGLTMDIMHTPFKTETRLYTIIDCPGHKEFIKNMITGASQADAAILVVSIKEGVEEQTREHAFLAKMLGIEQLVIAVNKMDETGYSQKRFEEFSEELRAVMASLGYKDPLLVPVSALSGENIVKRSEEMSWHKGPNLIQALDETINPAPLPTDQPMRGWVQDVYVVDGQSILACRIVSGILERGEDVVFQPSGQRGVVKRFEMFGREVTEAEPGDSVGLVVDGMEGVGRGEVFSYSRDPVQCVGRFVAEILVFADLEIREGTVLTIRLGTAEKRCVVQRILEKVDAISFTLRERAPSILRNGDVGKVRFAALEPICVERYSDIPELGRFAIEGRKGPVGAGIVLGVG